MSANPFLVPDLGEGLEEVTVTGWAVTVGDEVQLNQTLCTVETAKAEVEIPSPFAGRIVELGGCTGETLAVGALLVRIDTGTGSPEKTDPEPGAAGNGDAAVRKPVLVGYGADDTFDTSRRGPRHPATGRPKAKPSVRKLAAELGVDLVDVPPGPQGVISRESVLAASAGERADYDVVPVNAVQAAMAERMALSRRNIPDAHASVEVDCTNLLRLREQLRADADGELFTPFVLTLRLVVTALTRNKILNSTWVDAPGTTQLRTHHGVQLGFGVAAPRGLLVPVVADAHRKTTRELAGCVAWLIRGARAGTLKPAELQGSTFTVSNFGALGLDDGVPVINYPEAAILGMGSLKPRPAVFDGAIVARPQLTLTCVFDHRVADGAQVGQFLCSLRDLVESPATALVDL